MGGMKVSVRQEVIIASLKAALKMLVLVTNILRTAIKDLGGNPDG
jgi:hypothetical protein